MDGNSVSTLEWHYHRSQCLLLIVQWAEAEGSWSGLPQIKPESRCVAAYKCVDGCSEGIKLEKRERDISKGQPDQSHNTRIPFLARTMWDLKAMIFLQHYLFCSNTPPALGCFVGSWQKWWLPWMLFWAGLDTGATHTAASTHYTWKHPGLWVQHTHTPTHTYSERGTVSPSCHSELFWRQLCSQDRSVLLYHWTGLAKVNTHTHTQQLLTSRCDECSRQRLKWLKRECKGGYKQQRNNKLAQTQTETTIQLI